jgi:hypothetical protein
MEKDINPRMAGSQAVYGSRKAKFGSAKKKSTTNGNKALQSELKKSKSTKLSTTKSMAPPTPTRKPTQSKTVSTASSAPRPASKPKKKSGPGFGSGVAVGAGLGLAAAGGISEMSKQKKAAPKKTARKTTKKAPSKLKQFGGNLKKATVKQVPKMKAAANTAAMLVGPGKLKAGATAVKNVVKSGLKKKAKKTTRRKVSNKVSKGSASMGASVKQSGSSGLKKNQLRAKSPKRKGASKGILGEQASPLKEESSSS